MPKITPVAVNSWRALAVWAIRAAALSLLATGAYLFLKKLFFAIGFGPGGFEHMFRVFTEVGEQQSTYRGLSMLAVGSALALGAKHIARWIIALPDEGCPRCGYAGPVNDTCPECGQVGVSADRPS
ncbi:MAG: hypothetical protein IPJ41_06020 [Phycisphaerales bacterium]|nr:hypothetical protein [Phycisphaerales bacterium]